MTPEATDFAVTGRLWLRGALDEAALARIDPLCQTDRPGERLALSPALAPVTALVNRHFPGQRLTRVVAFNKTEAANWGVPWHQDRVIATAARHDVPGFINWSNKAGVWLCEPPLPLLSRMLFVRLHLDPEGEDSGPMMIALGSYTKGLIPAALADARAAAHRTEACLAARGDVLILHMLTLHRSLAATRPAARRTLRLDLSPDVLPAPLDWAA